MPEVGDPTAKANTSRAARSTSCTPSERQAPAASGSVKTSSFHEPSASGGVVNRCSPSVRASASSPGSAGRNRLESSNDV